MTPDETGASGAIPTFDQAEPFSMCAPGDTIGILGGGQLGRMLALAAARLGLRTLIYDPASQAPAFETATGHVTGSYDDHARLADFAERCAVITFEFENVPAQTASFLAERTPVRPGPHALAVAQDRLAEKRLARQIGALTADFASVENASDLDRAIELTGLPAVLKTNRLGYDGKGQAKITQVSDAPAALAAMAGQPAILESFVPFRCEVSVVAARALDGSFAAFDVTENDHRHHILHRSLSPARIAAATAEEALSITRRIAAALDYVGVLGVEFFVVDSGSGERLVVNEIAPRVHNSGHWTMDGALTCQFEQHMRAVAGWPLGATRRLAPQVEMVNLIGDEVAGWARIVAEPEARLHLYGKDEARPGRKMGHVNRLIGIEPH
jgi:5-(carboxyamino)imidazole ribonucleotide synthase